MSFSSAQSPGPFANAQSSSSPSSSSSSALAAASASSSSLASTLVHFLHSFSSFVPSCSGSRLESISSLGDGVSIRDFLHFLDDTYFTINDANDDSENSTESNLANILVELEAFLQDEMKTTLELNFIDVGLISRSHRDNVDLGDGEILKLLEITVLVAINSQKKELVVGNIMSMSESAQSELMFVINEVMARFQNNDRDRSSIDESSDVSPSASPSMKSARAHGRKSSRSSSTGSASPSLTSSSSSSSSSLSHLSTDAVMPDMLPPLPDDDGVDGSTAASLSSLQSSNDSLKLEVSLLRRSLSSAESEVGRLETLHRQTMANALTDLRTQLERQYSETRKQESRTHARDLETHTAKISELEQTLKRVQETNTSLLRDKMSLNDVITGMKNEAQQLRDSVLELNHKLSEASKFEARYKSASARLEAAGDMQASFTYMERQSADQAAKIRELEAAITDSESVKTALKQHKAQVAELQEQLRECKANEDRDRNEIERLKYNLADANNALRSHSETIQAQSDELATLREASTSSSSSLSLSSLLSSPAPAPAPAQSSSVSALESEVKSLRESRREVEESFLNAQVTIQRLEKENQNLQAKVTTAAAAAATATTSASVGAGADANQDAALKKKIVELEATIAELQSKAGSGAGSSSSVAPSASASAVLASASSAAHIGRLEAANVKYRDWVSKAQIRIKETASLLLSEKQARKEGEAANRDLKTLLEKREAELAKVSKLLTTKQEEWKQEALAHAIERRAISAAFFNLGKESFSSRRAAQTEQRMSFLNQQRQRLDD